MTLLLQVMLIVCSILNFLYTIYQIRKSKLNINDSIFSICFSILLVLMSLFPQVIVWISEKLGFYSASNFVLVFIVFILIVQILKLQTKVSVLSEKLKALNHFIAIEKHDENK